MRVAITGATGLVGQALCSALTTHDFLIRAIVRSANINLKSSLFEIAPINEIHGQTDWLNTLNDVDCIVHCAAQAHVMNETETDALAAYRSVNVDGTRRLAEQAMDSGVKRLVFISSIKVNGEQTSTGIDFTVTDFAKPEDPYGISKWEAEQALLEVAARTGLEVVIIRPPLVYGPGVKGNFLSLLGWLNRGIPLPLGAIDNMRSLVGIDNLVNLIITCIDHPAAANQTFLVSDGEDLSTTDLLRRLGKALHKPARLLPLPSYVLGFTAQLVGKKAVAQRLLGNLQVDISKTREVLDWSPSVNVDKGLQKTADWFLSQK
jgi:nucleoside-diphosphate-sugar epimerase